MISAKTDKVLSKTLILCYLPVSKTWVNFWRCGKSWVNFWLTADSMSNILRNICPQIIIFGEFGVNFLSCSKTWVNFSDSIESKFSLVISQSSFCGRMQGGRTDCLSLPHCSDEPIFQLCVFPLKHSILGETPPIPNVHFRLRVRSR